MTRDEAKLKEVDAVTFNEIVFLKLEDADVVEKGNAVFVETTWNMSDEVAAEIVYFLDGGYTKRRVHQDYL